MKISYVFLIVLTVYFKQKSTIIDVIHKSFVDYINILDKKGLFNDKLWLFDENKVNDWHFIEYNFSSIIDQNCFKSSQYQDFNFEDLKHKNIIFITTYSNGNPMKMIHYVFLLKNKYYEKYILIDNKWHLTNEIYSKQLKDDIEIFFRQNTIFNMNETKTSYISIFSSGQCHSFITSSAFTFLDRDIFTKNLSNR